MSKTFIVAPNLTRAKYLCKRLDVPFRGRDTYVIGNADSGRGCRFDRGKDRLVVDPDFPERRDAWECALSLYPAGIDLFPFLKQEQKEGPVDPS